jgi:hypothetical protein
MNRILAGVFAVGLLLASWLVVYAGAKPVGANLQITDNQLGELGAAEGPDVAANGKTLYAVWRDSRDHGGESVVPRYGIFFAKSTNGGATWSANKRVSEASWDFGSIIDPTISRDPSVVVGPDGTLWVIWWVDHCFTGSDNDFCGGQDRNNDILLARSLNGGDSFETIVPVDGNDDLSDVEGPALDVDPVTGDVDMLYHEADGDGYDIKLYRLNVGQNNAATITQVSEGAGNGRANDFTGPRLSVAARNGKVCAAWEDSRSSGAIYGSCSTNAGQQFGKDFLISGPDAGFPRIAIAANGDLYAGYQVDKEPFVTRSTDNGVHWSQATQLTQVADDQNIFAYDLHIDANGLVAALYAVQGTVGNSSSDLFLAASIDQGKSFSAVQLDDTAPISATTSSQRKISLAVTGTGTDTSAIAVWQDDRNTQTQIWATRAVLDGTPPSAPANLQATAGDTSIALKWSAATDANGIQGYRVLRASKSGGPYTLITPLLVTSTTYRDVGLPAATFFYQVVAVDGTGNQGPVSNEAHATAIVGTGLNAQNGTLVYQAGGQIHVHDLATVAAAADRTIGSGQNPKFNADGSRIFFYQNAGSAGSISSEAIAGGDIKSYYSAQGLTELFDVAANDNFFAAIAGKQYPGQTLPGGSCTAFEPDYRSISPVKSIFYRPNLIAADLALSPDRRWLAYSATGSCSNLSIITFSSPNFCISDLAKATSNCTQSSYHDSAFSPDGNTLAFVADFSGQPEIWKAKVDTDGSLTDFTQLTSGPSGKVASAPAWSSDGSWLVFVRDENTGAGSDLHLFVVRADGDSLRSLDIAGDQPAWFGGGQGAPGENGDKAGILLPFVKK